MILAILAGCLTLTAGILLFELSGNRKETPPQYVFTYAENQGWDYPTTQGAYYFSELVQERTEGRIKVLIQPGGVMGTENAVVEQIKFGGIDFTRVSLSTLANEMPRLNILQMPYLYESSDHMWRVLDGALGDEFLASFSGTNMVALSWYDAGVRSFYNSERPITCPEDMKGMSIRVQDSDLMVDMVEALGAEAVVADYGQVYSGLETGAYDGAENNWPSYVSMEHYMVAKYFTLDEHTRVPELQLCSQVTWDKLSEEDRQIMSECARESAVYERRLWREWEAHMWKTVTAKDIEITVLTAEEKEAFSQAVRSVYETYCAGDMDIIEAIKEQ